VPLPQDFNYKVDDDTVLEIGNNNEFRENVVIARSSSKEGKQ